MQHENILLCADFYNIASLLMLIPGTPKWGAWRGHLLKRGQRGHRCSYITTS